MKNFKLFLILILLVFISCNKKSTQPEAVDNRDILQKLQSLAGLQVTEITPLNVCERQFEILITQPLDHNNPDGIQFSQRIFLSHVDETAPVVFMPSGYSNNATTYAELSALLKANQIYVAHRFMTGARPDVMQWDYLTVEQAATDFHKIVELLKTVYVGKWVSFGASKNGDTALFHKRFYPNDVDATVSKVAPISFAVEDPRYETFLENVGDQVIRDKIKRFQIDLLENRSEILPLIRNYMDNSNLTFTIPEGVVLEFETLEYAFSFWQFATNDISLVPDTGQTAQDMFNIFSAWISIYSDEYIDYIAPFYYQMYTELGYYRLVDDYLANLLVDLSDPSYSYFAPSGVALNFNPNTMQDINTWLQSEGNNIIFLYGETDPWTAGAVELTGQTNAVKIIQPGANHSIILSNLDQKELVYSTLEEWLGIEVVESTINSDQIDFKSRKQFIQSINSNQHYLFNLTNF